MDVIQQIEHAFHALTADLKARFGREAHDDIEQFVDDAKAKVTTVTQVALQGAKDLGTEAAGDVSKIAGEASAPTDRPIRDNPQT